MQVTSFLSFPVLTLFSDLRSFWLEFFTLISTECFDHVTSHGQPRYLETLKLKFLFYLTTR